MAAPGNAELARQYLRFRQIATSINDQMIKMLSKHDLQDGARRLGMLSRGVMVFDSEDEMSVLTDFCLYDVRRNGQTAVERFAAGQPFPDGSDEAAVLAAMTQARHTLVQVDEVIEGVGARMNDVIYDRSVLVTDQGLGRTAVPGLVLVVRMLPFGDFEMTSGVGFPLTEEATVENILTGMARHLQGRQEDISELTGERKSAATANAIRVCLKMGKSDRVAYAGEDDGPPVTEPIVRENHVGRNETCTCGSGRKFKKCCGRTR